jgi:hypothetical protein
MLPIGARKAAIPRTLPPKSQVLQCAVLVLLCAGVAQAQLGKPMPGLPQQFESLHLQKSETRVSSSTSQVKLPG